MKKNLYQFNKVFSNYFIYFLIFNVISLYDYNYLYLYNYILYLHISFIILTYVFLLLVMINHIINYRIKIKNISIFGIYFSFFTLVIGILWSYSIWNTFLFFDFRIIYIFILFLFFIIYYIYSNINHIYLSFFFLIFLFHFLVLKLQLNWDSQLHETNELISFFFSLSILDYFFIINFLFLIVIYLYNIYYYNFIVFKYKQ